MDQIEREIEAALDDLLDHGDWGVVTREQARPILGDMVDQILAARRERAPDPDVLTAAQVAAHFGVGHSTVTDWCRKGLLRGTEQVGIGNRKTWRIPRSALDDFEPPRIGWVKGRSRKRE